MQAERELERIKKKMHKTEWNKGYYLALKGMLIASRSNTDGYSFLSTVNLNSLSSLQQYRRHFLNQLKKKFYEDFDRGYFSTWADYIRFLIRLYALNNPQKDSLQKTEKTIPKAKAASI
jgi:hypothetical protein